MITKYKPTPFEQSLLSRDFSIEKLSLVRRDSLTKLQLISQRGKVWVKSISDEYQMFRMIIFGLLCKIFSSDFNQLNQDRLDTFKTIVYEAKLYSLVEERGLEK